MSVKSLKNYFKRLKLSEIYWEIKADDDTVHPFTNLNVIQSFNHLSDEQAKAILHTLENFNSDRIKINNFLKTIAKSYCNNRIELIKGLYKDFKNANTDDLKNHFKELIDKFSDEDLEKAGLHFWRKKNHNWQLTPTWNQ
jgi:t-SNARE complex subunit (syntaxin)